eukprot:COSAG02_NODE_11807_length_1650_cov_2.281875_2_plen_190_part_00
MQASSGDDRTRPGAHHGRGLRRWPRHRVMGCVLGLEELRILLDSLTFIALTCVCFGKGMSDIMHTCALQVAATRATMAARREARAKNSAALSGATAVPMIAGLPQPPAAAFGRRSASSQHASGASTERWHRRNAVDGDEDDRHQQPRQQMGASARAGRRAAAAPVGGSPGLMAVSLQSLLSATICSGST